MRRLTIPLCCAAACLIATAHPSASSAPAARDPFHDVFYTYYTESRSEAQRMLSSLMKDRALRGRALVNAGKLEEIEKRPAKAIALYREAFARGERAALPYLYRGLISHNPAAAGEFLDAISAGGPDRWLAYERSLVLLRGGDSVGALRSLDEAVRLGLNSRALILREPLFDPLRSTPEMKKMLAEMKPTGTARLQRTLDAIRKERLKGTPLDVNPNIIAAGELEKKGKLAEACRALEGLLAAPIAFNERGIALYRLARLRARQGNAAGARDALRRHDELMRNVTNDPTGYRAIVAPYINDIVANDKSGLLPYAKP